MEEDSRMSTKVIIAGIVLVIAIPLIVASLVFIKDGARTQDVPEGAKERTNVPGGKPPADRVRGLPMPPLRQVRPRPSCPPWSGT